MIHIATEDTENTEENNMNDCDDSVLQPYIIEARFTL